MSSLAIQSRHRNLGGSWDTVRRGAGHGRCRPRVPESGLCRLRPSRRSHLPPPLVTPDQGSSPPEKACLPAFALTGPSSCSTLPSTPTYLNPSRPPLWKPSPPLRARASRLRSSKLPEPVACPLALFCQELWKSWEWWPREFRQTGVRTEGARPECRVWGVSAGLGG